MKLKEFIQNLNELAAEKPELLDMVVVSSSDDEGNSFQKVYFAPSEGHFNEDDREFHQSDYYDDPNDFEGVNAICIN